MVSVEIKKGNGIDGLVSGHSGQNVEEEKIFNAKPSPRFDRIMSRFEETLRWVNMFVVGNFTGDKRKTYIHSASKDVLNPNEIYLSCHKSKEFENAESYPTAMAMFTGWLVQNSYNAGNNDFILDLGDMRIDHMASFLEGTEERPLSISLSWENPHGRIANYSKHCYFKLDGFASVLTGAASKYCTFELNDGHFTGTLNNTNCIFKTSDEKMLRELQSMVPSRVCGYTQLSMNKIIRINPDGSERVMRNYCVR